MIQIIGSWKIDYLLIFRTLERSMVCVRVSNLIVVFTTSDLTPSFVGITKLQKLNGGLTSDLIDNKYPLVPPGAWIHTEWPSWEDLFLCSNSLQPSLINPGPYLHQHKYPVPVSVYEDTEQEEFWSIGIRNFGYKLLHYRTLNEGTRIDYETVGNGSPDKIIRNKRIRAQPLRDYHDTFFKRMNALRQLSNHTPEQRSVFAFGDAMATSTSLGNAFWTNTAEQNAQVEQVLTHMKNSLKVTELAARVQVLADMNILITEIVARHNTIIGDLTKLETLNIIRYPNRRRPLLAFNRGTRQFIRRILQIYNRVHESWVSLFRGQLDLLERHRMLLWAPGDVDHINELDQKEYDALQAVVATFASGNINQGLLESAILSADPAISPFTSACNDILSIAADKDSIALKVPHLATLGIAVLNLRYLRNECPSKCEFLVSWSVLKAWKELFHEISEIEELNASKF